MSLQKLADLLKDAGKTFDEFDVQYFAKKASDNYITKKASLNEAIKKIAQEEKFNTEQTRRICEAANHIVNQHLFDTQDDKNVYFEVADVNNIEMSNTLDKLAQIREFTDYDFSPKERKKSVEKIAFALNKGIEAGKAVANSVLGRAASGAVGGAAIAGLSGGDIGKGALIGGGARLAGGLLTKQPLTGLNPGVFKAAQCDDWEISALDPKLTLLNLKEKIAAVNELAREKREANEYKIKEANWKLYNLVKDELQDTSYFKIAQVIAMSTDKHEILEDITEQLLDNKIITEEDVFSIVKSAEEFNKNHPIVKWTEKYAQLLSEQELLFGAEKETEEQLKILAQELK
jgi:hypothetical protein